MAEQPHLTAVVCQDHTQYRNWCFDNGRNPRDPSLRLVLNEQHARGYWFDDVILLGGSASLRTVARSRFRRKTDA